jgi:hypothetical protein
MQDPVNNIVGVGPKAQKALQDLGITTVEQLANLRPGQVDYPNLGAMISRAKSYIKLRAAPTEPSSVVKVSGTGVQVQTLKPELATPVVTQETKFLIDTHSWADELVNVPDPVVPHKLLKAVVYELCVEPGDRVVFLCEWFSEDDSQCIMSYSPQLIFYLNPHLPELTCEVDPDDWSKMPKTHILQNVLWETNSMRSPGVLASVDASTTHCPPASNSRICENFTS